MLARCPQASWSVGPSRPELGGGALHIWFADLAQVPAELLAVLSDHERARAARILDRSRAQRWASARALGRELLGRYARRDPRSLEFVLGTAGKPELVGNGSRAARPLHFNTAHSGRLALYGLACDQAVGVDLEDGSKPSDEPALTRPLFGAGDGERPPRRSEAGRRTEFLSEWVRAESALKCLGGTLAVAARDGAPHEGLWHTQLRDLPGSPGAIACVAAPAPPSELCLWAYR